MRVAKILNNDLANGPGLRTSVFVSGCSLHCPGCHNPGLWDFRIGTTFTPEIGEIIIKALTDNGVSRNLSILGGEPLTPYNQGGVIQLCQQVKQKLPNTEIWIWTGYEKEELSSILLEMLTEYADVLVCGRFIQELKPGIHPWRGSSNQEIIRLK